MALDLNHESALFHPRPAQPPLIYPHPLNLPHPLAPAAAADATTPRRAGGAAARPPRRAGAPAAGAALGARWLGVRNRREGAPPPLGPRSPPALPGWRNAPR